MKTYFFTYLCSLLLAVITTPIIIWIAHKYNLTDKVNARKVHSKPIPRIGGLVVFISTNLLMILVLQLDNRIGQIFRSMQIQIISLLVCSSFIFAVGLIDDLHPMRAKSKLLAQLIAAIALTLVGIRIETINVANLFTINFGIFSYFITIFWILAITNAVNLIDGLDGLATGICAIACITIGIFAFSGGQILMAVLMLAVLGSLTGFLFFNFNPAKIFLGDCGSMYLGFILATCSIICSLKSNTMVALALPVLALGLPIFDTTFSILRRYLGRWGIMSPDRGHLHHRLLDMGLHHRNVVIIMYAITALASGFGLFMIITHDGGTVAVFFSVIFLLTIVFRAFGAIRLREVIAKIKYKNLISKKTGRDIKVFENTSLELGRNNSFRKWWKTVSQAAEKADLLELELKISNENLRCHKFVWKAENAAQHKDTINVKVPINNVLQNVNMEIEFKMPANGSLESFGRKMMLFGRLVDEYEMSLSIENADKGSVTILSEDIGSEKTDKEDQISLQLTGAN